MLTNQENLSPEVNVKSSNDEDKKIVLTSALDKKPLIDIEETELEIVVAESEEEVQAISDYHMIFENHFENKSIEYYDLFDIFGISPLRSIDDASTASMVVDQNEDNIFTYTMAEKSPELATMEEAEGDDNDVDASADISTSEQQSISSEDTVVSDLLDSYGYAGEAVSEQVFFETFFVDELEIIEDTIIELFTNSNAINTGDGDDLIGIHGAGNTVYAGSGNDIINILQGYNNIKAGEGNDYIEVYGSHNIIDGEQGDDIIHVNSVVKEDVFDFSEAPDTEISQIISSNIADLYNPSDEISTVLYDLGDGDDILSGIFNIQLGENITRDDVTLTKEDSGSFISFSDGGSIDISGAYYYESITFYDGTELDLDNSGLTWVGMIM